MSNDCTARAGRGLRPDFLLWVNNALLFKGEEKAGAEEMADAIKELVTKMTCTWAPTIYGDCLYQLAYAAAGSQLRFVAIR